MEHVFLVFILFFDALFYIEFFLVLVYIFIEEHILVVFVF